MVTSNQTATSSHNSSTPPNNPTRIHPTSDHNSLDQSSFQRLTSYLEEEDDDDEEEDPSPFWEYLPTKLNLNPTKPFSFIVPSYLTEWCGRMEGCFDASELDRICKLEVAKIEAAIARDIRGNIVGKEIDFFHFIMRLHFIQLVAPTAGSDKLEWLHPALALCNWHNLADSSLLGKLGPKSWLNRAKMYQMNQVPIMTIYSILGVALTTSFRYLPLTIDSLTLMFNILQKDLRSDNEHVITEALKALVWFPESALVSDNLLQVLSLLKEETDVLVAKKALQVACRVLKHRNQSGSGLGMAHSHLVQYILYGLKKKELQSVSLSLAKVAVQSAGFPVRAIIFSVTGVLSKLIYDSSEAPWVQAKCVELLSLVAPTHASLSKIFFPLVMDCLQKSVKVAGSSNFLAVACTQAIGSMFLVESPEIHKSFEYLDTLIKGLFIQDPLSQKAALRMLNFLLPHHSYMRVNDCVEFLFSEIKDSNLEAVKLGVLMGIERRLSDAISSAGNVMFSVAAIDIMVQLKGYSEVSLMNLVRVFRSHFPFSSERGASVIQKLEDCVSKSCEHVTSIPFHPHLLKATHTIFFNSSSYITYTLSKHPKVLLSALTIANLDKDLAMETLVIESLWVFLEHFEFAFQKDTSNLRQQLMKFNSPLKYVIIRRLDKLSPTL